MRSIQRSCSSAHGGAQLQMFASPAIPMTVLFGLVFGKPLTDHVRQAIHQQRQPPA
jgi:hypothetical protein